MQVWTDLCDKNGPMLLEAILCKFGRIWATRNGLMLLETILFEIGRICATGKALVLLETILCKLGQICERVSRKGSYVAGNSLIPVWIDRCDRKCCLAAGSEALMRKLVTFKGIVIMVTRVVSPDLIPDDN